jgi:predicted transcriptional regulator
MTMTLRLSEEETRALRAQAEVEQRSMQDVARAAVREYVARHSHLGRVDAALDVILARREDLLRRLGDS